MQHIAYHSSMDLAGFFCMLQNDHPRSHMHDLGSLDMAVGPYSCNGDDDDDAAAAIAGSVLHHVDAGAASGQARHGGDERKRRRLASNRESARRSRVRKQRRLDELSARVAQLRAANQRLLVELNHAISSHARVVHENAKLREEASDLQRRLDDMGAEEAEAS